jgi:hypothetical protein
MALGQLVAGFYEPSNLPETRRRDLVFPGKHACVILLVRSMPKSVRHGTK